MRNNPHQKLMQRKIFILGGIMLLMGLSTNGWTQEVLLDRSPYMLVQIMVPGVGYDDDGTRFTRFPAYVIYNEDGKDILRLPSCFHKPYIIRMLPGTYHMEVVIEGEKIKSSFEVAPQGHFQQFEWPASEALPERLDK